MYKQMNATINISRKLNTVGLLSNEQEGNVNEMELIDANIQAVVIWTPMGHGHCRKQ